MKTDRSAVASPDVDARWATVVEASGGDPRGAAFPREARQKILAILQADASGVPSRNTAVIAGFFYRDVNGSGIFDPGEECPAELLGAPTLDGGVPAAGLHRTCYWLGPLVPGTPRTLSYAPGGMRPYTRSLVPTAGLNLFPIPVVPEAELVYVVPHSHFDTEWVFSYEECLRRVEIPNINQRIDLLQKQPAHCFALDEECVTLPYVERAGARYAELLRRGIREGAIEPKGIVTQQELTMPYGESLIRNITIGENMLSDLMGEVVRPEVYWSVDQYGIGFQLPQILAKTGRPYFLMGEYIHPSKGPFVAVERIPFSDPRVLECPDFLLKGLDGTSVLVHRSHYAMPEVAPPLSKTKASLDSSLVFQGWDNVEPDPELPEKIRVLNARDGAYRYIIATSPSFFRVADAVEDLPTLSAESFITWWSGVYESRVTGRLWNRRLENAALSIEPIAAAARLEGMRYPRVLAEGWYLLLLNQHHDPLMTPMAVPDLFDNAIPARAEAAGSCIDAARVSVLSWMGVDIATNEAEGQPVIVFNPHGRTRSAVVEAEIPSGKGAVSVRDRGGRLSPCQARTTPDGTTSVAFLAEELPAVGWKTYYLSRSAGEGTGEDRDHGRTTPVRASADCLENEFVRIDVSNGQITSVTEKTTGTVVMKSGGNTGINELLIWKDEGCISVIRPVDGNDIVHFIGNPDATLVGRSSGVKGKRVEVVESGPVRGTMKVSFELDMGRFVQFVSLEAGSPVIRFRTDVIWEPGDRLVPGAGRRVRVAFTTAYRDAAVSCDIPFGVIPWEQSETIRPTNSWLGVDSGKTGLAFCHSGPPSIQAVKDVVYMTLFRSVLEPTYAKEDLLRCSWDNAADQAADAGRHVIDYSVHVHPGGWEAAHTPEVVRRLNTPVFARRTNRHSGFKGPLLPGERSYISLEPADLVMTAFKPAEYSEDGTVARFYNPTARTVSAQLEIGFPHELLETTNFREERIARIEGSSPYRLTVGPFEIVTVKIT